jgi:hypothetical protein
VSPTPGNSGTGHDTATLKAFPEAVGQLGGLIGILEGLLPIDSPAVSLRFNAKSGIVAEA